MPGSAPPASTRRRSDVTPAFMRIAQVSCPAKSDVSDFARLIAAEVGQGRLRLKSDVSDFARLIAAEVGQGRLRLKVGHPTPLFPPEKSGGRGTFRPTLSLLPAVPTQLPALAT